MGLKKPAGSYERLKARNLHQGVLEGKWRVLTRLDQVDDLEIHIWDGLKHSRGSFLFLATPFIIGAVLNQDFKKLN